MSLNRMINPENVNPGAGPSQPPAPGMFDIARAGYRAQLDNYNTDSRDRLIDEGRSERDKQFKEIAGKDLTAEMSKEFSWNDPKIAQLQSSTPGNRLDTYETRQRMEYYKDLHVKELRQNEPNLYGKLKTQEEINEEARQRARMSSEEFARLGEMASSKGKISAATGYVAGFAGQLAAGIQDPFNLATMAITSGASLFSKNVLQVAGQTTFKRVAQVAGAEALENVAQEVLTAPLVSKWQKEVGNEYGLTEFVENVAVAGVLGGTLGGVVEGGMPSARWLWGKVRESDLSSFAAKKAAGIMERVSHLKEANPFLKGKAPSGIHEKGIQKASEALVNGRSLDADEIMPESTFIAQDTNIPEKGNDILRGTAKEMDEIRGKVFNQTIESEKYLDSLSPARLREIGQASDDGKLWRVHIEKEDGSHVVVDAIGSKTEARAQVESLHLKKGDFTTGIDPVRMKISDRKIGKVTTWDGNKGKLQADGKEIPFAYRDIEEVPEVGQNVHFDSVEGEAHGIGARAKQRITSAPSENLAAKQVVDKEISAMISQGDHPGMSEKQAAAALAKGSGSRYKKLEKLAIERIYDGKTLAEPPEGYTRGSVQWFDESSGEGMIISAKDQQSYYVHYSAIKGTEGAKTLSKGDAVDFKLYENLYMKQVDEVQPALKSAVSVGEYQRALGEAQQFTPDRFDSGRSYNPENRLAEDLGIVLPESESQRIQREYIESYHSESVIKAEQSTFDDLVKENGDMKVMMEDGKEITVKELADSFKGDEQALAAMQSCSI